MAQSTEEAPTKRPATAGPPDRDSIPDAYRSRVEFVCVYIQEAHPRDGWQVLMNTQQAMRTRLQLS